MDEAIPDALRMLLTRTVVRQFTDRPVDDGLVELMLEAMVAAPSASNRQAWAFVAVRDPRTLRLVTAFSPGVIDRPPLLVAACFDRSRTVRRRPGPWDEGLLCVAMAVQNLLLAAHALGLGGCPVASFRAGPVRRLLGLPAHIDPVLLVPVGHPARSPTRAPRRDLKEVISHDFWGRHDRA
ncbi:nitroreductase family protein [Nonomuraea sp. FMUSA5-5]|uniref:Nitroreductase family protein n=1 Tax=Nonomuraea composti TaxID=2720023 RepID=A0ABX1BTI5_9ACTN|nr:nitroreductase family protein [Nonomuraea sp. FMUSA5-5]NJP98568.1 nitroreductase family protein [Nonomuraea sp. FMUSA5-5]